MFDKNIFINVLLDDEKPVRFALDMYILIADNNCYNV